MGKLVKIRRISLDEFERRAAEGRRAEWLEKRLLNVDSWEKCEFCGRAPLHGLVGHHWYQPPQLEEHRAKACSRCNVLLIRRNFLTNSSVASIPHYRIERKARQLWRRWQAYLREFGTPLEMSETLTATSPRLVQEIVEETEKSTPDFDEVLREVESHVLPSFEEQKAFIIRRQQIQ